MFNYEQKEHRGGRVAERERLLAEVEEDILVEEEEGGGHDGEVSGGILGGLSGEGAGFFFSHPVDLQGIQLGSRGLQI